MYIFLGAFAGFLGISVGLFVHLCVISTTTSFGVPYLSPFIPASKNLFSSDLIDLPIWKQELRPSFLKPKSLKRQPKISRKWTKNYKGENLWKIFVWLLLRSFQLYRSLDFGPVLLSYPQNAAKEFGSGAVLHYLYVTILVSIFYFIFYKLYKGFEGKNIFDITNFLGGKTLENIFGFCIATYLLVLSVTTIHEFGQDIKNMMFTSSLVSEINLLLILGIALGMYTGIRGLFRTGSVIFPLLVTGVILLFLALYSKIDLTNLTPIFGTGYNQLFLKGSLSIGIFNSLIILFFVAPSLNNLKKTGIYSILFSSATNFLILFLLFSVFPYESLRQNSFAIFELTRMIGFGRFFQRLESIFTLLWIIVACIFLGVALRFAIEIYMRVFNFKYIHRLIPCVALLILNYSILIPDYATAVIIRKVLYNIVSPILFFICPLLILLLAKLKFSGGKNEAILDKS